MPLVEKRYAEALISIASQVNAVDEYQQEIQSIVNVFMGQLDFNNFLLNPEITTDNKKQVIKKIFDGKTRPELVNFLMLLIDKGRMNLLSGILDEYILMADRKKNILSMTIISATPLDDVQIKKIEQKYMQLYNASSVKTTIETDKNLIGGIKIKIGDKVIDGTIKGRLKSLKQLIVQ